MPSGADSLWAESGFCAEARATIGSYLVGEREAIVEAGTSWVVGAAVDLQGRRPRSETKSLVARVVDLHLAWLLHDDLEPRRQFIEFVTTYRASDQFRISTLLRGFSSFKKGVQHVLPDSPFTLADRLRLLIMVDSCSEGAIHEMSDIYVGKLNEKILEAREQEVRAEEREAQLRLERERNTALELAKQAAETANAAKSRFLAHMSHELRTPLNSVIGFSQYLVDEGSLSAEQRQTVDDIHQSGQALLDMIDEVLEMSRIEAGAVELRPTRVDLPAFLRQLHTILAPHVAPGVRFDVHCEGRLDQHFQADRSKLRQILLNLLGNALKFTVQGYVLCSVRQLGQPESDLNQLEFIIEDTGPGIAEGDLHRVFDAFVQSKSGEASGKGVGLGLSITESHVRLLGGSLRAASVVGKGTTFTLAVPVGTDRSEAGGSWQKCTPEQAATFRILVVDDHEFNRRVLCLALARWGFVFEQARDGPEAIHKARTWKPDLVFMDIRMVNMDGLEATRQIRAELKHEAPAIIALTASAFGEVREQALQAGCEGFVLKPFDYDMIAQVLYERLVLIGRQARSPAARMVPASEALTEAERAILRVAAIQLDLAYFELWFANARGLDSATKAALEAWVDEYQFGKVLEWTET